MLPVPMIATRSACARPGSCPRAGRGCGAAAWASGTRPKRSSRNGSSSGGRCAGGDHLGQRPAGRRRERHALHRVARWRCRRSRASPARSRTGSPSAVIGRMPAHSDSISGDCPGLERAPARPSTIDVDPAPVEPVVDAAELHRPADPHAVAERRAADVDVDQQDRVRRHDASAAPRSCSPCRAPSGCEMPIERGERRRPRPGREHDRVRLDVAGGGAHVRQPRGPRGRARTPRRPPGSRRRRGAATAASPAVNVSERTCQCWRIRKPASTIGDERRLELVQLGVGEDVVGQLVAEVAHRRELAQLGAGVVGAAGGVDHALLVELELDAVGAHLLDQVEHVVAEPRDRAPCRGRGRARCSTSRSAASHGASRFQSPGLK